MPVAIARPPTPDQVTNMPTIAQYVSNYSSNLHYRDLPDETVHLLKRMVIDTVGCAIGGYTSEPAKIARDLAGDVTGPPAARHHHR